MRGTGWKKLTRNDLVNFDDIATDAVLTAMSLGAIGRITGRGHFNIRGRDRQTMSVTHNTSAPRVQQSIEQDLRRLFPELREKKIKESVNMEGELSTTLIPTVKVPEATNGSVMTEEMLECPVKDCDKEFVTDGALYAHVRDDHATCTETVMPDGTHSDGCHFGLNGAAYVGMDGRAVAGHVNIQHYGNKPWTKRDNSFEARQKAALKGAATKALKAKKAATPKPTPVAKVMPEQVAVPVTKVAESKESEHRGLPQGDVKHQPTTPAAKLAAIRAILGDDPKVAALQAEVEELRAHLDLVREALSLDTPKKK